MLTWVPQVKNKEEEHTDTACCPTQNCLKDCLGKFLKQLISERIVLDFLYSPIYILYMTDIIATTQLNSTQSWVSIIFL